jgi:hypothetical protein
MAGVYRMDDAEVAGEMQATALKHAIGIQEIGKHNPGASE